MKWFRKANFTVSRLGMIAFTDHLVHSVKSAVYSWLVLYRPIPWLTVSFVVGVALRASQSFSRAPPTCSSHALLARFLAQIKSMALSTPTNGRILRMTCPEHEGQVLKLFVLILSKATSCLTVYFSLFFFFFLFLSLRRGRWRCIETICHVIKWNSRTNILNQLYLLGHVPRERSRIKEMPTVYGQKWSFVTVCLEALCVVEMWR